MLEWSNLYAVINDGRKLRPKEREEIIEHTDHTGEDSYNIDELEEYNDIELTKACISAENDYALSQI